jgi:hypothetical protein
VKHNNKDIHSVLLEAMMLLEMAAEPEINGIPVGHLIWGAHDLVTLADSLYLAEGKPRKVSKITRMMLRHIHAESDFANEIYDGPSSEVILDEIRSIFDNDLAGDPE